MNKKGSGGGDDVLILFWILVVTVISVIVFIIVAIYTSKPVDLRDFENSLLEEKIIDCVSVHGQLVSDISSIDLEKCINLNTEFNEGQIFIKIQEFKADCDKDCLISEKISGRSDFEIYCGKEYSGKVPKCKEVSVLLSKNEVNEILKIKTAVGKVDKNVL